MNEKCMKDRMNVTDLPRVKQWQKVFGGTPGLWDYLAQEGSATLALAFAALFWPRFVEIQGCVLLRDRYQPENFRQWWERLAGRVSQIEATINHIHLWDLFDPQKEEIPESALEELAYVLATCWECALRHAFPKRMFTVTVSTGDEDYGPTVTFASLGSLGDSIL